MNEDDIRSEENAAKALLPPSSYEELVAWFRKNARDIKKDFNPQLHYYSVGLFFSATSETSQDFLLEVYRAADRIILDKLNKIFPGDFIAKTPREILDGDDRMIVSQYDGRDYFDQIKYASTYIYDSKKRSVQIQLSIAGGHIKDHARLAAIQQQFSLLFP